MKEFLKGAVDVRDELKAAAADAKARVDGLAAFLGEKSPVEDPAALLGQVWAFACMFDAAHRALCERQGAGADERA